MHLTEAEYVFMEALGFEALQEPFGGPITKKLHEFGYKTTSVDYLWWAWERDALEKGDPWNGKHHPMVEIPWETPEAMMKRNEELKAAWRQWDNSDTG